jgi:hypothetical protein
MMRVDESRTIDPAPPCHPRPQPAPRTLLRDEVLHRASVLGDVLDAGRRALRAPREALSSLRDSVMSLAEVSRLQGDSTFSVPAVSGCGPNGDGSFDAVVNGVVGLPSPSGNNNLVLDDAGSALALPNNGQNGQEVADAWHSAFD